MMICSMISLGLELQTDNWNEEELPMCNMRNQVFSAVQTLIAQGCQEFITTCEYGAALWAAEAVVVLKQFNDVKLRVMIPYEEQTSRWPESFRDRYFSVHQKADAVELVDTGFEEGCYEKTHRMMIEQCDIVVFFGAEKSFNELAAFAAEHEVKAVYCPFDT